MGNFKPLSTLRRAISYGRGGQEIGEALRSRVAEMRVLISTRVNPEIDPEDQELIKNTASSELDKADEALGRTSDGRRIPGSNLAIAQAHLDMAHSLMLRLAPPEVIKALLPGVTAVVFEHLSITDPRNRFHPVLQE